MTQISEETLRQIIQYLWNQHVMSEQQWMYYILAAPIAALMFYLILWLKHKAHCPSLLDALSFFFAPRGPERMLILKTLDGRHEVYYSYSVIKSERKYLLVAGIRNIVMNEDPEAYAEPVSLLDARGPSGVPSPFGLWVRQMVASYIMLAIVAVGFANTFWVTATVYAPATNVAYTTVDLVAFTALILTLSWFITTLLRALSPQTMLVALTVVGTTEEYDVGAVGLDVYSSHPPERIIKSLGREFKVVLVDTNGNEHEVGEGNIPSGGLVAEFLKELTSKLGSVKLAAIRLISDARAWAYEKAAKATLQDLYNISLIARSRYIMKETKIPRGFLQRYAGVLALIAIILAVGVIILWLQPSIAPAMNATGTAAPYTPATPPPPPTTVTPLPKPASPPPPSG